MWKCLHDEAPSYLADLCIPVASTQGRQQLRSASSGVLVVPRTRTSTGQRSFAVNGQFTRSLTFTGPLVVLIQAPAEDLPVPSLRVSGSRTTVRRHCDCTANLAPIINRQTYLPTATHYQYYCACCRHCRVINLSSVACRCQHVAASVKQRIARSSRQPAAKRSPRRTVSTYMQTALLPCEACRCVRRWSANA